jgi:hypothetical protein
MYILPLPEINAGTLGHDGVCDIVTSIPESDWWLAPPRNPTGPHTTAWYKLSAGDPVYELYVNQFAIPRDEFDNDNIRIRCYQLLPYARLYNHMDHQRLASIFINLQNFSNTRFYFYSSSEKDADPMLTLEPSTIPYLVDGLKPHGVQNFSNAPRFALTISFYHHYTFEIIEQMYKDRILLTCQQ